MRTITRDIVGGFILSADDKILLGKSGVYTTTWSIPGGGIEDGETILQALAREIKEETGIDISRAEITEIPGRHTGESEKTLRDTGERVYVRMTFHDYKIRMPQHADMIPVEAIDDFVDARWIPLHDLRSLALAPPTATQLRRLGYLPNNSLSAE